MPLPASTLDDNEFMRLGVEGIAKIGKTRSVGASLITAFGFGYIIECGTETSLGPLKRVSRKFEYDIIRREAELDEAIKDARKGVKEGKYKWVLLDDFNLFATILVSDLEFQSRNAKGEPDGRKYWPEYHKRLGAIVTKLVDIRVHLVMTCHPGCFNGKSGEEIPGKFTDFVQMDFNKGKRQFLVNSDDTPGRSCRSIDGSHVIDADVGALWKLAKTFDRAGSPKK